jgi:acetylornithine deacetylase
MLWSHSSAFSVPDEQQQPLVQFPAAPPRPVPNRNDADAYDAPSYRSKLLNFHKALVDIPSISGSEGHAAILLNNMLRSHGYTVDLQCLPNKPTDDNDNQPPRCNVLAWPGPNANPTLTDRVLVTSHIDVVPPYIPYHLNSTTTAVPSPLDLRTITPDTLISGRGTVDAKASVAAQIIAVNELLAQQAINREDVVLLYVVGEETSGEGMKFFSASLPPNNNNTFKSAVFGEPTENKLACGHKGIVSGIVRAHGKAGHSGYPWLGKSATALLVRALGKVLDADLGRSERFGNTTVNVGLMEGGVAANVIAKEAWAKLAIRDAVGGRETGAGIVERRLRGVLEEVDSGGGLELEMNGGYGPVEFKCDFDVEF